MDARLAFMLLVFESRESCIRRRSLKTIIPASLNDWGCKHRLIACHCLVNRLDALHTPPALVSCDRRVYDRRKLKLSYHVIHALIVQISWTSIAIWILLLHLGCCIGCLVNLTCRRLWFIEKHFLDAFLLKWILVVNSHRWSRRWKKRRMALLLIRESHERRLVIQHIMARSVRRERHNIVIAILLVRRYCFFRHIPSFAGVVNLF